MSYSLLRSRTFYTIVAMFIIGGTNAISSFIPSGLNSFIMLALGALGSYFHLQTGNSTAGSN